MKKSYIGSVYQQYKTSIVFIKQHMENCNR